MGDVEVVPVMDVSPGTWLAEHLGFGGRVRDVVSAAFEAHALVTHHADDDGGPPIGCLDRYSLAALRDVLLTRTTTQGRCWFALWEGHPGLPRRWDSLPKLHLPQRAYLLFGAPVVKVVDLAVEIEVLGHFGDVQGTSHMVIDDAGVQRELDPAEVALYAEEYAESDRKEGLVRSPNLWWPDDHAWVVGTDIDGDDTLVAGSHDLIDAILAHPDLDATPTTADETLTERT